MLFQIGMMRRVLNPSHIEGLEALTSPAITVNVHNLAAMEIKLLCKWLAGFEISIRDGYRYSVIFLQAHDLSVGCTGSIFH
jgi:hypothetical protein